MIFWPCCCDKDCSCIGCATLKIEGASSHPDYGTSDVYTELAYNRTVVMWDKDNSTDTPFDLLGTPGDCGDDYTNYPGTKCKGQSFACCSAHYYDDTIEPIPMVVGGVTQTPPTPEAGSDCFPALSCFYDISQPTIWLTKPEQPTHHYYVDKSGYVWLAVISYEFVEALQALRPHWVFIYKSSEVINCQTVNSGGSEGTSFTMTAVCDGLAAGVDDCSAILVPLLDMSAATITLMIYPNVTYCCDLGDDPCNDDSGLCDPGDVPCVSCSNGTASYNYLIEVEGIVGGVGAECCNVINASYVVSTDGQWRTCYWAGCFSIEPCGGVYDNIFIAMSMERDVNNIERIQVSAVLMQSCSDLAGPCIFGTYSVAFAANETCKNLNRKRLELDPLWTAFCIPSYYGCDFSVASVYVTAI